MTEGMVQDFVKDLLNSIRERGIDTKAAYTVFIGGGAKLLRHFLNNQTVWGNIFLLRIFLPMPKDMTDCSRLCRGV